MSEEIRFLEFSHLKKRKKYMSKKLIISALSLMLVSSVYADDNACDQSAANDNPSCEKTCEMAPVVENTVEQEGQTPEVATNSAEAAN